MNFKEDKMSTDSLQVSKAIIAAGLVYAGASLAYGVTGFVKNVQECGAGSHVQDTVAQVVNLTFAATQTLYIIALVYAKRKAAEGGNQEQALLQNKTVEAMNPKEKVNLAANITVAVFMACALAHYMMAFLPIALCEPTQTRR